MIAIPTVHLNGTSRAELIEQLSGAISAITAAIEAAQRAYPNGRDYYPQGSEAFAMARRQWLGRVGRLAEVRDEFSVIAEAINV